MGSWADAIGTPEMMACTTWTVSLAKLRNHSVIDWTLQASTDLELVGSGFQPEGGRGPCWEYPVGLLALTYRVS